MFDSHGQRHYQVETIDVRSSETIGYRSDSPEVRRSWGPTSDSIRVGLVLEFAVAGYLGNRLGTPRLVIHELGVQIETTDFPSAVVAIAESVVGFVEIGRFRSDCGQPGLGGCDQSGYDLCGCDLYGCDLYGCDQRGYRLCGYDQSGYDQSDCHLD